MIDWFTYHHHSHSPICEEEDPQLVFPHYILKHIKINSYVIEPSGCSSLYFLKICATGFLGLSSCWCTFCCGLWSSKCCARGLCGTGCGKLRCGCCCCTGFGLSILNLWAFDGMSTSCGSDVNKALGGDGGDGCDGTYSSSGSSITGLASCWKCCSNCCGLCCWFGFLTRICVGIALPCCCWLPNLIDGNGIAPGIFIRGGVGPSYCDNAVDIQHS